MSHVVTRILNAVRALNPMERAEFEIALRELEPPAYPRPDAAAIAEAHGKFRHVQTSVDEFLQRKREDLELE